MIQLYAVYKKNYLYHNDTGRLNVKGWTNICPEKFNQKSRSGYFHNRLSKIQS